jgi:hypothetical protein
MAANRKVGRPKKPLTVIVQSKRNVGRPAGPPLLQDPRRRIVAMYYAHTKVVKMRTMRGNRKLGANSAATWLAAIVKSMYRDDAEDLRVGLLKGQAAGEVTGAAEGFVANGPEDFVPVVPMRPGSHEPLTASACDGLAKTWKNMASEFLKSDDPATLLWFSEAVKIFGLAFVSLISGNPALWIEAHALAASLGDQKIIECLRGAPGAPKLSPPNNFLVI